MAAHWFLTFTMTILGAHRMEGTPRVPLLNADCLVSPGDLTLALISGMSDRGNEALCELRSEPWVSLFYQFMQGFVYALEEVNRRDDLLPNVTLGYVIMDSCWRDLAALGQALYLIPQVTTGERGATPINNSKVKQEAGFYTCGNDRGNLDVVGVVGPGSSAEAVMVAGLFTVLQIPMLATLATNDDLSDKSRYEYFTRLVPPDSFQVEAILKFIQKFKWTYISLLYSEGIYGENAAKVLAKASRSAGICIAVSEMVSNELGMEEAQEVAFKLEKHKKARVVIVFIQQSQMRTILSQVQELHLDQPFIWISGDALADSDLGAAADGAFVLSLTVESDPEYSKYYLNLTPSDLPADPWIRFLWEMFYDCSWDEATGNYTSCAKFSTKPYTEQFISTSSSMYMDGALAFGHALHNLLERDCPHAFSAPVAARGCVSGPRLLEELRAVQFNGYSGSVSFDEKGDRLGTYTIKQYHATGKKKYIEVAHCTKQEDECHIDDHKSYWTPFLNPLSSERKIPESICSKPCSERQYAVRSELLCCWECRECRTNERIIINVSSSCEICPELTWPDEYSGDTCEPIPPMCIQQNVGTVVTLSVLAGILLLMVSVMSIWIYHHRRLKLIKASSPELNSIILLGVTMTATISLSMLVPPNNTICQISTYGFHISVTILFVPQLLKAFRIYRIFSGSKKGKTNISMTSNRSMVIACVSIVLVQTGLVSITGGIFPTRAGLRMPIPIKPEVELFCDTPLMALIPGLAFNLLLLALCSGCGFMSRKLPENFNESWYIFVGVSTTIFAWLLFLPTYFTTFYAVYRVVLLASCLLINGFVTLACVIVPKVYAVHFVDECHLKFSHASNIVVSSINTT